MKKQVSLTEGSIPKGIIRFAIPLLLSNLFQQLYNSVDTAVVGSYAGSIDLAAVGSTGALINLLIGFFLGIATGTGVLYAMRYGAEDYKGLKKLTDAAFFLAAAAGVLITVLGMVFAPQMLALMGTPDDVMDTSLGYLRIYLSGTVFNMLYNVGAAMIQSQGNSAKPLLYLFISGVINLIVDIIFVAGFGMGADGAALATVIAQAISAVLVLRYLIRLKTEYRFRPKEMKIELPMLKELIRISIPCGLQGSMFNISNLLIQAKINGFGSIAMAGISAYSKIDGFIYMPMMALCLTVSTYVGQNIGADRFDRVKKGIRICMALSIGIGFISGWTVILCFKSVIGLFTDDPVAIDFARRMMWFMAPFTWTYSVSDILGGSLRGAGAAVQVTTITALCICVFRVVWLAVMLRVIYDIRIVFLCYPLTWILSSIVMSIYYFRSKYMKFEKVSA